MLKCDLCHQLRGRDSPHRLLCAGCAATIQRLMSIKAWADGREGDKWRTAEQIRILQQFADQEQAMLAEREAATECQQTQGQVQSTVAYRVSTWDGKRQQFSDKVIRVPKLRQGRQHTTPKE